MTLRHGRNIALAMLMASTLLAAGCAKIRAHKGHMLDSALVESIQPGIDNRQSVAGTLGRPTFMGQFDDRDWYYVSRNTKRYGYDVPTVADQTVLHIRFDEAGNVAAVERSGIEQVASIDPMKDKTPTLGQDRTFFEELFGNIGTIGSSGIASQTADNPQ